MPAKITLSYIVSWTLAFLALCMLFGSHVSAGTSCTYSCPSDAQGTCYAVGYGSCSTTGNDASPGSTGSVNMTCTPSYPGSNYVEIWDDNDNIIGRLGESGFGTCSAVITPTPTPIPSKSSCSAECVSPGVWHISGLAWYGWIGSVLFNSVCNTATGMCYIVNMGGYTAASVSTPPGTYTSNLCEGTFTIPDCTNFTPTYTPTPTPTPSVTTIPPVTYPTIEPSQVVSINPNPTHVVFPTINPNPTFPVVTSTPSNISTLPTIVNYLNSDDLYNYTITTSPYSKPLVDFVKTFEDNLVSPVSTVLSYVIGPINGQTSTFAAGVNLFTAYLITFSALPVLFVYAVGVLVQYMPEKVQMVATFMIWLNVLFYTYDRYQGRKP